MTSPRLMLCRITSSAPPVGPLGLVGTFALPEFGVAYESRVTITGGGATLALLRVGALPLGLVASIDTGTRELVIAGTPLERGTYAFTLTVSDEYLQSASIVVSWTIAAPAFVLTGTLDPATEGEAYSSGLGTAYAVGAVAWSVVAGALPAGIGPIDPVTGIIPGTPTESGSFPITIRGVDSIGQIAESAQVLEVAAAAAPFNANDWANCTLWLDFTDMASLAQNSIHTTPVTADNQTVLSVDNKGANAPGDARWYATGDAAQVWRSNLVNGRGGLELVAATQKQYIFRENNAGAQALSNYMTASAKTMFMLFRPDITNLTSSTTPWDGHCLLGDTSGGGGYWGLFITAPSGTPRVSVHNYGSANFANQNQAQGSWIVVAARHNGTNVQVRVNNGSWVSTASGNTGSLTGALLLTTRLLAGGGMTGAMRTLHAVCYNAVRSDAECDAIIASLMAEAGLS